MVSIYTSYRCRRCNKEFILDSIQAKDCIDRGHYITCPYCGCKRIKKGKETDDLREVTKGRAYKRVNGRLREIK